MIAAAFLLGVAFGGAIAIGSMLWTHRLLDRMNE